jgi:hypothetical protein
LIRAGLVGLWWELAIGGKPVIASERSERGNLLPMAQDCFVTMLLAMTGNEFNLMVFG